MINFTYIGKNTSLALIIIFLLGSLIYANILNAPFQLDDTELLLGNPLIKDIPGLLDSWSLSKVKHFTFLTFAINYHFGKRNVIGYHIVNIILHILSAFLLYFIIRTLFLTTNLRDTIHCHQKELFSLFVSLIFLAHPLQTESVTYIWQRSEVLSGFFYLAAYLSYLIARVKGKNIYYIGAIFLFCVGYFAKGLILTLPIMILVTETIFFNSKNSRRALFAILTGSLILWCTYISSFEKLQFLLSPLGYLGLQLSDVHLYNQFKVFLYYIKLSFIPLNQNADYYWPICNSFLNIPTILSFLTVASIFIIAFRIFKRHRLKSFGIFWFFIPLIPTSIFLREPIWEHRLYLSLAGFSILFVSLLFTFIKNVRIRNLIAIGVIMILCELTVARNFLWCSPIALLEDTVKKSPLHARAHLNLGVEYLRKGRIKKAEEHYLRALQIRPDFVNAHNNLGSLLFKEGKIEEAAFHFRMAINLEPKYALAHCNYSLIFIKLGRYEEAKSHLLKAMFYRPNFIEASNNLGKVFYLKGDLKSALNQYYKTLKFDYENANAHNGIGVILAKQGNFKEAIIYFRKALKVKPNYSDV